MRKIRLVVMTLLSLALALPAFGKTSKNTYPAACSELWGAVKDVLGNAENYNVEESNDTLMTAAYKVKHNVHVTVTGAVLQRTNHVALVSKVHSARCKSSRTIADLSTTTVVTSGSAWRNPLPS